MGQQKNFFGKKLKHISIKATQSSYKNAQFGQIVLEKEDMNGIKPTLISEFVQKS